MGGAVLSISKDDCLKAALSSGFQAESIEKVSYLLDSLNAIFNDSFLGDRLVLKGGTALNLFHFSIPRLSVDIDLNYVGATDQKTMEDDRTEIENRLKAVCKKAKINLQLGSNDYANRGYKGTYKSDFSSMGMIKIDINYLHRICLWAPEKLDSIVFEGTQAHGIPVISLYELTAGKLCALLGRSKSRDLFDVTELATKIESSDKNLRLAYLWYAAKQPKDWRTVKESDIRLNSKEVESELFPMLSKEQSERLGSTEDCTASLVKECRKYMRPLLKLTKAESEFFEEIRQHGRIKGSLLTESPVFISMIEADPALIYRCSKAPRRGT